MSDHLLQADRCRAIGHTEVLVDFVAVRHLRAGESDQLPADQSSVAAMHGVGKHALNGMAAEHLKEGGSLDGAKLVVLLFGCQIHKSSKRLEAGAVNFAGRFLALISVL